MLLALVLFLFTFSSPAPLLPPPFPLCLKITNRDGIASAATEPPLSLSYVHLPPHCLRWPC